METARKFEGLARKESLGQARAKGRPRWGKALTCRL